MEVEASQVGDGGYSREGSKNNSTPRQMDEEVQKIGARPSKVGVEKEGGQRKRGQFDLGVKKKIHPLVLKQTEMERIGVF